MTRHKLEHLEPGTPVVVHWNDATGSARWQTREFSEKMLPSNIESLGRVLNHSMKALVIAATQDDAGSVNDIVVIPLGMVTKVHQFSIPDWDEPAQT